MDAVDRLRRRCGASTSFIVRARDHRLCRPAGQDAWRWTRRNTAYALAAKKILKNQGLLEGRDYQRQARWRHRPARGCFGGRCRSWPAGLINPPLSTSMLKAQGLKSLGTQYELLGPYQATGAYVMRNWAKAQPELLHRLPARLHPQPAPCDGPRPPRCHVGAADLRASSSKARPRYQALTKPCCTPGSGLAVDAAFSHGGLCHRCCPYAPRWRACGVVSPQRLINF